MTLSNQMPHGYFFQEIGLFGSKGFLRVEGAKVTGLIYSSQEKLQRANSRSGGELTTPPPPMKETLLYTDTEDSDFLLTDRNIRTTEDFSALLPSIYMESMDHTHERQGRGGS